MDTAVQEIWANCYQELKQYIHRRTGNPSDTEDILQNVFLKIIENIDKVSNAENLRQYLYAMVRNAIADFYKKEKSHSLEIDIPENVSDTSSENTLTQLIAQNWIVPYIQSLPPKYRDALMLSEIEGLSQIELADRLGISYSGAKSRVQRGREKLKAIILECCHLESDKYGNILNVRKNNCSCD